MPKHKYRVGAQNIAWERDYFADLMTQFGDDIGPRHSDLLIPENGFLAAFPQRRMFEGEKDYVEAFLSDLQGRLNMRHYPIQTTGLERDKPKLAEHRELNKPVHNDALERYYTDIYGRPVAYYEPSRLGEPLYLLCRMSQVLTDIVQMAAVTSANATKKPYRQRTEFIASFLGLGPVYELTKSYFDQVTRRSSQKGPPGIPLRGTLLFLHHKGCPLEQIQTDYAHLLMGIFGPVFDKEILNFKNRMNKDAAQSAFPTGTLPVEYTRPRPIPA
ncbi:hypothetical protein [Robiginitomaculum antarcticum]|uniref:hypothetical protein n=1 Tax=Robiginitomaculum antarcticum TaxID=437507 RepID=UPI00037EE492|nr:hypothetical protein [Robiginitomaculum antarcticum]